MIRRFMCLCLLFALTGLVNAWALEGDSLLLTPEHGGDGSAWGQARCESCHLLNFIHQDLPIREIARRKGYAACGGCHGDNGAHVGRPCTVCHNPEDLPQAPRLSGHENHNFAIEQSSSLHDGHCLACHESSDMDGAFEANIDLTRFPDRLGEKSAYANTSEFCLRCHNLDHQQEGFEMPGRDYRDPLVAMENNYRHIDMHGLRRGSGQRTYAGLVPGYSYSSVVDCEDCHAMHGTENKMLIIDHSAKGARKLASPYDYPVRVEGGDYSQLCVLCHRMHVPVEEAELDTGNGLSGVHLTGSDDDCRDCHTHGRAVQTGL